MIIDKIFDLCKRLESTELRKLKMLESVVSDLRKVGINDCYKNTNPHHYRAGDLLGPILTVYVYEEWKHLN